MTEQLQAKAASYLAAMTPVANPGLPFASIGHPSALQGAALPNTVVDITTNPNRGRPSGRAPHPRPHSAGNRRSRSTDGETEVERKARIQAEFRSVSPGQEQFFREATVVIDVT